MDAVMLYAGVLVGFLVLAIGVRADPLALRMLGFGALVFVLATALWLLLLRFMLRASAAVKPKQPTRIVEMEEADGCWQERRW